ncbi:MAG: shikimate dehydrogenase [Acetobacteraceae bacterium]|nr:shikimate dehydrogenase [Acetobacteraceae bacterium]
MAGRRAFILGHPIAHSRSPMLHGYWLRTLAIEGSYEPIDMPPERLGDFFATMQAQAFVGGNITVPNKVAAMPFMDRLEDEARVIGAVNTVWVENGALVGGNTDAAGFVAHLDETAPGWAGPALVLGAGGAARAAVHGLRARRVPVDIVNRTYAHAAALADRFGTGVRAHPWDARATLLRGVGLLVNTTSLGMSGKPPLQLDLSGLPRRAVVYDIVYVPLETDLLREAKVRGHRVVDGLGMLLHQAVPGFARWFGVTPRVTPELRALLEADVRG